MKLLREFIDNNINLTNNQKRVLIICATSATPQQALESTIGDISLVTARDILLKLGMINLNNNGMELNPSGEEALIEFNLLDENGELTEHGQDLIDQPINEE